MCDPGGGCGNVQAAGQEGGQRQRRSLPPSLLSFPPSLPPPSLPPPSLPSVKAQLHLVGTCPVLFLTTVPALVTSGVPGPTPFRQLSLGVKVQLSDLPYGFQKLDKYSCFTAGIKPTVNWLDKLCFMLIDGIKPTEH